MRTSVKIRRGEEDSSGLISLFAGTVLQFLRMWGRRKGSVKRKGFTRLLLLCEKCIPQNEALLSQVWDLISFFLRYWQFQTCGARHECFDSVVLGFVEKEIRKANIPIMDTGENPEVPFPRDMIDLEVNNSSREAR